MMRQNNLDGVANVEKSRHDRGLRCALIIVVGFRGPLQNHMVLGISCSCTKSIDVFS
jgi:hypothetical protein